MVASKLLRGGTVISYDDDSQAVQVLRGASVLIADDRIAAIADEADLQVPTDAEIIDVHDKIVSPGFVNTHAHTWQSVFRTLAPDTFLSQYLNGWLNHVAPTTPPAFTPEDVYISCLQGHLEGLYAGVTSCVDHAHNNWSSEVAEPGFNAAVDSGARVWWCYDIWDRENFTLKEQWEMLGHAAAKTTASSLVQPGLALDGLSSLLPEDTNGQLKHTKEMIGKLNLKALTLHHLGGPWPHMKTSPVHMCESNLPDAKIPMIFSHAPFLTNQEQHALRHNDMFVSITPESEFHYGHGQVSGIQLADRACLGVDTNFTFSADMMSQARLWLQTARHLSYAPVLDSGLLPRNNPVAVEQAFLMATRQGGRALHRPDLGVLQPGAKADIVVFSCDTPSMLGWSDPVAAVILHANAGDVQHVLVDGQFRKRNFELEDLRTAAGDALSWAQVREQFLRAARRIQPLVATPPPLPNKLWGVCEFGDAGVASKV